MWFVSKHLVVRSFQGALGQTHTHKPRKGVRGRRSHRQTLHTLTGASLIRCGIRGLGRRGPPFRPPPGIAGPGARPGRLCTAYRAPRARHRWFPRLPCPSGASFSICAVGSAPFLWLTPLRVLLLSLSSLLVRSHEAHQSGHRSRSCISLVYAASAFTVALQPSNPLSNPPSPGYIWSEYSVLVFDREQRSQTESRRRGERGVGP